MIQIKNVTKLYPAKEAGMRKARRSTAIHALDHISLHVTPGEWLSIMGPSGSGKSTLVNLIGCLDRPTSGEIWLDGQERRRNFRRGTESRACGKNWLHLPAVSSDSLSHRGRKRNAGAVLPQHDRRERSARGSWRAWDWETGRITCLRNFPEASSSGCALRGH